MTSEPNAPGGGAASDSRPSLWLRSLPFATPRAWTTGGRIKVEPEDFVVEEIAAYAPSGEGEHLFLWIEKTDLSAEGLTAHVARSLGIRREAVGVAGLKDRRAVTRQWLSVPAVCERGLAAIENDAVHVLNAVRHGNKLRTGHLRGNRFEILIRDVDGGAPECAAALVEEIAARGLPNFFGEQRFGGEGQTLELGRRLLCGAPVERLPPQRRKFLKRLALSAAQSALFNKLLAARMELGLADRVLDGDVMQVAASGGLFVVGDAAVEQDRHDRRETFLTGPIFGPKMKRPAGRPAELEGEVLQQSGFTPEQFCLFPKLTPGTRRPLRLFPENLGCAVEVGGIRLRFSLPSGAYATTLLREFTKQDAAGPTSQAAAVP